MEIFTREDFAIFVSVVSKMKLVWFKSSDLCLHYTSAQLHLATFDFSQPNWKEL